ncbi:putative pyridine nucleotide-disulfide oxidoreductase-like protein [Rosellinia necatrix]|uniref:Putative pyridine nucleotide-disulfide oxidoreductase-like protein n=1 Tax=Rosellinia necatrix TaxID=77044 RepID=A0A1W2TSH1_ROSNE|nr:putative pyridine nucleotide-disulfide oxidoreductase-like protein [Rosellinia necatrix]
MAAEFAQIQQKYAEEAQKRVKAEGLSQFQSLSDSDSDRLRHLADDIWADHAALDAQVSPLGPGDCPKFLIAGAGVGGILAAVRLIQQGFTADQIRLVETAGGVGGTWYWNRYPGLHCDVESYIYMPLLEETGFMPSHKYASGVEIRTHLKNVVKKYQLEDKILFRAQVGKFEWDGEARHWKVDLTTWRGPEGREEGSLSVNAEFVYMTAGLLAKPQIPKVGGAGFAGFKGDLFHTSLWNYDATGGSSEEAFPELSKLAGKRVGILGTGATAIQAVPCLAKYAKELYVFQRTPSAVFPRGQRPTDPDEWATSIAGQPGWFDARNLNFAQAMAKCLPDGSPDLVDDQWSSQPAYRALTGDPEFAMVAPEKVPEVIGTFLALDAPNAAGARQRIKDTVRDPATAEKLTPWYPTWCKRPTFSDTYLETFNSPHVHLVDTDGKGIDGVSADGIVVKGTEYPVDVLVLSTGYVSPAIDGGDPSVRAGITVVGPGGRTLSEKFTAEGPGTLYGVASSGFPNIFWLGVAQSVINPNHSYVLDTLARISAHMIGAGHAKAGDGSKTQRGVTVEVDAAAEQAWTMRILQGAARFATLSVCTPSYISAEMGPGGMGQGQSQEALMKSARRSPWSGGMPAFLELWAKWRDHGDLEGVTASAA